MADRHRLGTFVNGRFTAALDLAPSSGVWAVERDTFAITPPAQTDIKARNARRYGGSKRVGELHDNGNLAAQWFIKGANLQATLAQLDSLLAILESSSTTYYWEWRPDGATYSTYFEVRGTSWEPLYRWVQTAGTGHLHVKLGVDIAPLALGDHLDINDDFSLVNASLAFTNLVTNPSVETDLSGWTLTTTNLTNLAPNPSFEYGLTPWTNSNGTFLDAGATTTQVTSQAYVGTHSMQVDVTNATAQPGVTCPLTGTFVSGTTYAFSLMMKGNAGGEILQVVLTSQAAPADHSSLSTKTLTNGWTQITGTWTPSANRTDALLYIRNSSAHTYTYFVDALMINVGATAQTFFDGDTSGASWTGTAGNSTSTKPNATLTQSSAWSAAGTKSARFTASAATDTLDSPSFAVTALAAYSVRLAYNAAAISAGNVALVVHWSDGTTSTIATLTTAGSGIASGTFTAPAGVTTATIRAVPSTAGTFDISLDAVMAVAGNVVPSSYADKYIYTGGLLTDYSWDTGTNTLIDYTGALVPTDTTEKRLYHSARGYLFTDAQATLKVTPGASVAATHSTGLILRRVDTQNFLWASVDDSNTLRIFKRVAGVDTQLATGGYTPAASTVFWVRFRTEGNVLFAEAWSTEPTLSGTPNTSLTYALSAAEAATFGATVAGAAGIRIIPQAVDWAYDDFRVDAYTYKNRALPELIDLRGVPGTAPAQFDLSIGQPPSNPRIEPWGLVGWTQRPALENRVWNGDFEDATLAVTGWGVGAVAGVIGAATSIARITTAGRAKYGAAAAQIVTPATTDTGASFPIYRRFKKGTTYTIAAYLSAATDVTAVRVKLGVSGDIAVSAAAALTTTPTLFTTTWTPAADTDVAYAVAGVNAATATTFAVDGVQVFEGTTAPTTGRHAQGAGAQPPFGILQAEAAIPSSLTGLAVTAAAGSLGGYDLEAGALTTFQAEWFVDPSLMAPDDFATETTIEAWARLGPSAAGTGATATLTAIPENNAGQRITTNEWGTAGKTLVLPSSSSQWRVTKLGSLTLPVDPANPSRWRLRLVVVYATAATLVVDHLLLVPSRQRALGPTSKANDSSYPALFHASGVEELKTVRSDLSGRYSQAGGVAGRDTGLGGQLLELPAPGGGAVTNDVQAIVKLSDLVPDDPTSTSSSEAGVTVTASLHFAIRPRFLLTRSA